MNRSQFVREWKAQCQDYDFFRRNELWIPAKSQREGATIIRFDRHKRGQAKIKAAADKMMAEEGRILLYNRKARKIGSSTEWVGRGVHGAMTREFWGGGVVASDDSSTRELERILKTMYACMNRGRTDDARIPWPRDTKNNPNELALDNGSYLNIRLAGSTGQEKDLFRGGTPYYLLGSECAFWGNAAKVWLSMSNAVAMERGSGCIVVLESTSNGTIGRGEWWYKLYKDEKAGLVDWRSVFIGWFDDEENESEPAPHEADLFDQWQEAKRQGYESLADRLAEELDKTLRFTRYEQELTLRVGLSVRQLRWFADLLRTKYTGDLDERLVQRAQENASTEEESFSFSGAGKTFSAPALKALLDARPVPVVVAIDVVPWAEPAIVDGCVMTPDGVRVPTTLQPHQYLKVTDPLQHSIVKDGPKYRSAGGIVHACRVLEDDEGDFEFFEEPRKGASYYCGVDASMGSKAATADSTAGIVMRYDETMQSWWEVCTYSVQGVTPDDAADAIEPMLRLYFNCMVNPETPGPGKQIIERLVRHHAYGNIYRQRSLVSGRTSNAEYGWHQSPEARDYVVGRLDALIKAGLLHLRSQKTIAQFMELERHVSKTGRVKDEHPKRGHDDHVFAVGCAIVCPQDYEPARLRETRLKAEDTSAKSPFERELDQIRKKRGPDRRPPPFLGYLRSLR